MLLGLAVHEFLSEAQVHNAQAGEDVGTLMGRGFEKAKFGTE